MVRALAGVDTLLARTTVEGASPAGDGWLPAHDAQALLDACGIPTVPTLPIGSEADAIDTAARLGFPVVMKGAGPRIVHKTEAHAVHTDLIDGASVAAAYRALAARRAEGVEQILMQPMVRGGVEFLAGAVLDPTFGHVMVCGSGGTMAELMRDTGCRLHPLTDVTARELLDGIRGVALLRGFRGMPAGNENALRDILLRLSALIEICPEIVELDLNPIIVTASGARAVDVRVRLERPGLSGTTRCPSP
jgi:acetyltransferase